MPDEEPSSSASAGEKQLATWSVFDVKPEQWPDAAIEDLSRWKQGHVITGIPVTWLMPPGKDDITLVDNPADTVAPCYQVDERLEGAIICSQTCDIGADSSPGSDHPFILVAPLIRLSQIPPGQTKNLAKQDKVGWLFPTLPPVGSAADEKWFADLRMMVPLSKSVLLDRTPIDGFNSEADSLDFSETIAQKFRRAALSEQLSDTLPKALRKFIQDRGKDKPAFKKVEQVRLVVLDRDRLQPKRANLIVIMDSTLVEGEFELWRQFEAEATLLMREVGITMMPMTFTTAAMPANEYRKSVPLFCDLLPFPNYP